MKDSGHEWKGIDHVQFACSDMDRTIKFWESIGMKCTLKLVLHHPERYHFFVESAAATSFHIGTCPDGI